ncbi:Uncharacterized conserved protein, DUF2062 family [Hymenobacter gelipurpurascens]|uniref:Uncharacterized conserved protein, DUF2062 family n=1 Tax=Hymenobacter gelipurpurascens TaxID=89968 RepID=A0A212T6D5_9BACT|nr:DUF2062 domain-containing protein [Hymenobacter gelipurpurascens]SNC61565.1 Uncharacterized conserved protein, DUF2062 family [Hymenobacter gelipurpurascens]
MNQPIIPPPVTPPSSSWWRRRLVEPLRDLLRQGLTPHQLALTIALGTVLGLVPVLGITTLLATFAAVRLRLNVAATLLIAHLWSPVQLLLLIPLLRWGNRLLGNGADPELTLVQLQLQFKHDWLTALQILWKAFAGGLLIWGAASVPVGALLYFLLRPLLRRVMARQAVVENNG